MSDQTPTAATEPTLYLLGRWKGRNGTEYAKWGDRPHQRRKATGPLVFASHDEAERFLDDAESRNGYSATPTTMSEILALARRRRWKAIWAVGVRTPDGGRAIHGAAIPHAGK